MKDLMEKLFISVFFQLKKKRRPEAHKSRAPGRCGA
jgi:hypothetical protein